MADSKLQSAFEFAGTPTKASDLTVRVKSAGSDPELQPLKSTETEAPRRAALPLVRGWCTASRMAKIAATVASLALLLVALSMVLAAPEHAKSFRATSSEPRDCPQLRAECEARCGSRPDFHCSGKADALQWSCACGGKAAVSAEQALAGAEAPAKHKGDESQWCRRQRKNCEHGCESKSKTRFMCDDEGGARSVACSCVSGSGKGSASVHTGGSSSTWTTGSGQASTSTGDGAFAGAGNAFTNNPAWDQVNNMMNNMNIMHGR